MHIGMPGTMDQFYLTDLRDKEARPAREVLQGRVAGGKAFGYDVVEDSPERGGQRINPSEAQVVRRIFTMFANGLSPRANAHQLNAEHVPDPEGRSWHNTTIRGQKECGTGILNNALDNGELIWNRCSHVKDPSTGKRLARPNPPERWERKPLPELRILKCIRENLLTADLVAEFTRAYEDEMRHLAAEIGTRSASAKAALAANQRKIDAILRAVEDGLYQPSMKPRLSERELEKVRLAASARAHPTPVIAVHPNLAELYRKRVSNLEILLQDPHLHDQAMELIRSMIETIELTPDSEGGMAVLLHGDLARILALCAAGENRGARAVNDKTPSLGETGFRIFLVAGVGFEPTTFRL